MAFHVPNHWRVREGKLASTENDGNNGSFGIHSPSSIERFLWVIASDGAATPGAQEWEHVSVHVQRKRSQAPIIPNWDEMCFLKAVFWDSEDVVIQYHPRSSEYVNAHKSTLHLWRPVGIELPTPPHEMIGPLDDEIVVDDPIQGYIVRKDPK